MKAFEEWLEEHPGRYTIPALKMGWIAAFKRILDECHHHKCQDVIDFILEELDES